MARATMATLIARLRVLVGDPAGGSQAFSDDELQDALDARRVEVRDAELTPVRSVASGGAVGYLEFMAPRGGWEADEVLKGNAFATLTPAASDRIGGRWTFDEGQTPPVYVTGQVFDLNAAAADVLEAWAAKTKSEFDFASDGQIFDRSQKSRQMLAIAGQFRRRALPPGPRLVTAGADW